MGGTMSRNKGKRGEREVINEVLQPVVNKVCAELGVAPILMQRNTLQSDRGGCDLVGLHWFAPEVKRQETLNLNGWWSQCVAQAGPCQTPVLLYRQNKGKWRVRMRGQLPVCDKLRVKTVVEISLDSFLTYFESRLRVELEKEIQQ